MNWGEVTLFTRPRRFGKTLNMSMLKSFFEIVQMLHCLKAYILQRIKNYAMRTWESIQ